MIDTDATQNYLASTQVERLGLVVGNGRGRVKIINSPSQPDSRISKGVLVKLGPYEGKFNLRLSKCSFAQKQIDFLGHVIEEGRIKMDQQKIQAVTDSPPPKDIHALRAFLGLCNFYQRFVKNYSHCSAVDKIPKESHALGLGSQASGGLQYIESGYV
nr:uncharacterized protein LOC104114064 [Nicotiana tomentosiformis]